MLESFPNIQSSAQNKLEKAQAPPTIQERPDCNVPDCGNENFRLTPGLKPTILS